MGTGLRLCALLLFLMGLPGRGSGQQKAGAHPASFSIMTDRDPVVSLAGLWRFRPGDDARFARPEFEDSGWKLLHSDEPWSEQGFDRMSGYAWYRFRVTLPAGDEAFSMIVPSIDTSYECFLDGVLVHRSGSFPPTRLLYYQTPVLVPLPQRARTEPQTVVVALRVWHSPVWSNYTGGGPEFGSATMERAGPAKEMQRFLERDVRLQRLHESAKFDLAALDLLAGLTSLALFALRRSEREYLWFGIAVLAPAIPLMGWYVSLGHLLNVELIDGLTLVTRLISRLAYVAFFSRLLHARRTWLLQLAVICLFLNLIPMTLLEGFGLLGVGWASLLGTLTSMPFEIWVVWVLIVRSRERLTDARLLLGPVVLIFVFNLVADSIGIAESFNHPFGFSLRGLTITYPFPVEPTNLADGFFLLAMLAILVNRFARTRRDQDRTASELEAARSVQQVLIPEAVPETPGLRIQTAYHPAQEVGGDFFQIIPMGAGDLLIVLGDVSGKGLPAAMTVSLAVGAIRTLADFTPSPGDLLAGLNRRLYGRSTGFTTCLALLISADGSLRLANAGHLAPYLNGRELPTEPALPLGLDPEAVFVEDEFSLRVGDRLTLVTDGIPEAMCRRELFGFARTENLSMQPAAYIAEAARNFGQTDDITVLSIECVAVTAGTMVYA